MDEEGIHTGEGLGSAVLSPVLHRHQWDHSEGILESIDLKDDDPAR